MTTPQIVVVSLCVITGAALYLAPRTALETGDQHTSGMPSAVRPEFSAELNEVKKAVDVDVLSAIEYFETRLEKEPGNTAWLDSLSQTWDRQMRPGIAAEYVYQKAYQSNRAADWISAGRRYVGLSRYFEDTQKQALLERGIECLKQALEQEPGNTQASLYLGIAFVESGTQPMEGITLIRQVAENDPANVEAQLNLGFFSMQSGQFDKAVERFKKVVELEPESDDAKLYLGQALASAGRKEEALKELRRLAGSSENPMVRQEAESNIQQIEKH